MDNNAKTDIQVNGKIFNGFTALMDAGKKFNLIFQFNLTIPIFKIKKIKCSAKISISAESKMTFYSFFVCDDEKNKEFSQKLMQKRLKLTIGKCKLG